MIERKPIQLDTAHHNKLNEIAEALGKYMVDVIRDWIDRDYGQIEKQQAERKEKGS